MSAEGGAARLVGRRCRRGIVGRGEGTNGLVADDWAGDEDGHCPTPLLTRMSPGSYNHLTVSLAPRGSTSLGSRRPVQLPVCQSRCRFARAETRRQLRTRLPYSFGRHRGPLSPALAGDRYEHGPLSLDSQGSFGPFPLGSADRTERRCDSYCSTSLGAWGLLLNSAVPS